MSKDYILQIKVKNGPMLTAMREAGIYNAAQLARATNLTPSTIARYLNLQERAVDRLGAWRPTVLAMAKVLGKLPEDLFPAQHLLKGLPTNKAEIAMDLLEVERLIEAPKDAEQLLIEKEAMDTIYSNLQKYLSPREERAIRMYYGIDLDRDYTYKEIGVELGVGAARVNQIIWRSLRKLKRPYAIAEITGDTEANELLT